MAYARGWRWVEVLGEPSAALLVPYAGSTGWLALGAAVGRCRRTYRDATAGDELPGAILEEVRGAADRLRHTSGDAELLPLLALAEPLHDPTAGALSEAGAAHRLHPSLARADVAVQYALRGVAAPGPVLVLGAERFVIFGRVFQVSDLPRGQAAAFWVLAENAGRSVPRTRIRQSGGIRRRKTGWRSSSRASGDASQRSRARRHRPWHPAGEGSAS